MNATVPETMTAIRIAQPGGPQVLESFTRNVPHAGEGEILIAVAAAGVNRPDVFQRMGLYPPPPGAPEEPGLEVAGRVAKVGRNVERFRVGDPVCALVAGGGYAEYAVVDASNALPVPQGLSWVEAAGLPETYFTVWHNVFERGRLTPGETFLVHGGASGIGTTAIQLAHAFGARVLATAGSPEKCRLCEELGAARAINYLTEDYVAAVKEATDRRGADLILDMVGGDYIERNYEAAAVDGRIVQIAFLNGSRADVDFNRLMRKRLTHTGSTLRPQPLEAKARIARGLHEKVWPLLESGKVRPIVHATFPLEQAADAHKLMDSGQYAGKIILVTKAGSD
jgi:NADPH2:quinone reductase